MGFLDVFFRRSDNVTTKEGSKIDWYPLTSVEQIYEIKQESETQLVGVFKHSIRCGISSRVLKHFNRSLPNKTDIKMYYLDLIAYREVSNKIAKEFKVIHQSPQLLIIKKGVVIKDASHYDVLNADF